MAAAKKGKNENPHEEAWAYAQERVDKIPIGMNQDERSRLMHELAEAYKAGDAHTPSPPNKLPKALQSLRARLAHNSTFVGDEIWKLENRIEEDTKQLATRKEQKADYDARLSVLTALEDEMRHMKEE